MKIDYSLDLTDQIDKKILTLHELGIISALQTMVYFHCLNTITSIQ